MKTLPISQVVVEAPATTANLGPGFDVFGLALEYPSDKVTIIPVSDGITIKVTGTAADTIPKAPEKNTAGVVANQIIGEYSLKTGLAIRIKKGVWPSVGLGSSAASAAAVAFGLNYLFNLKLNYEQLIQLAAKGEVASAGFEHADNVSAALYGDFIIIKSYNPLKVKHLKSPPNMDLCIAIPQLPRLSKKTEKARSILPKTISIEKLVHNVGHAATMAAGFALGDIDLIGKSMSDAVVEPVRASLIPGFQLVKEKALKAGASGVAISGAGPAIVAIVNRLKTEPSMVAEAMRDSFKSYGVKAKTFCTKPGKGTSLREVKQ